jgi:hypothetical protein
MLHAACCCMRGRAAPPAASHRSQIKASAACHVSFAVRNPSRASSQQQRCRPACRSTTCPHHHHQIRAGQITMLARGAVAALLVAWARAQTLTPAQADAISQCVNGGHSLPITEFSPTEACHTKHGQACIDAQKKAEEGSGSGGSKANAQMRAAAKVCVETFSKDVANYMPRSGPINASATIGGARRRLSDGPDWCTSACQKFVDCSYDETVGCLEKISGVPSGFVDAYKKGFTCSVEAQMCTSALCVCSADHAAQMLLCRCSDPGRFTRTTGFVVLMVAIGVVVAGAIGTTAPLVVLGVRPDGTSNALARWFANYTGGAAFMLIKKKRANGAGSEFAYSVSMSVSYPGTTSSLSSLCACLCPRRNESHPRAIAPTPA